MTGVHSGRIDDEEVEDLLRMLEGEAGVLAVDALPGGGLDNADRVEGTERTDKPDRAVETDSCETVKVDTVSTDLAVQPDHMGLTGSEWGELGSSGQATEEGRDSSKERAGAGEWGGLDSMFDPDVLASFEEDLRREWEYRVSLAELVGQEEEELGREVLQQQMGAGEEQNEQPDQEARSRQSGEEEEKRQMQQQQEKEQQEERRLESARTNPAVRVPKRSISGMSVNSDGGFIIDGFEDFLMEAEEEEAAFLQQQQHGAKSDNDQAPAQVHQSPRVRVEADDGLGDAQGVGFEDDSLFDPELLATMEAVFHRHDPADCFLLFSIAFIVFHPHPDADKLSREPRTIEIMNVDLSSNRKFRAARISYDASQAWTIVEGQLTAILEEHSPDDDPVALEAQQFQAIASMTEE
ncbi:unnamed protein product [Closterium sp. Yama58-4]|nr:unnamed protein product [Closterium sp. Yama58-4]